MGLRFARRFGPCTPAGQASSACHRSRVGLLLDFKLHLLLLRLSLLRLFVESLVAFQVFFFQALFANLSASWADLGLEVMLRFSFARDLMARLLI